MVKLIRILGLVNGAASTFDGLYVKAYDPSVHWPSGRYDGGRLETTADPAEALRFADASAAVRLWQSGPEGAFIPARRWPAMTPPSAPPNGPQSAADCAARCDQAHAKRNQSPYFPEE